MENLKHVHSWINRLSLEKMPIFVIGRNMKTLHKQLENIKSRSKYIVNVQGYRISFLSQPTKKNIPREAWFSTSQKILVSQEIHRMFKKGAVRKVHTTH